MNKNQKFTLSAMLLSLAGLVTTSSPKQAVTAGETPVKEPQAGALEVGSLEQSANEFRAMPSN